MNIGRPLLFSIGRVKFYVVFWMKSSPKYIYQGLKWRVYGNLSYYFAPTNVPTDFNNILSDQVFWHRCYINPYVKGRDSFDNCAAFKSNDNQIAFFTTVCLFTVRLFTNTFLTDSLFTAQSSKRAISLKAISKKAHSKKANEWIGYQLKRYW